MDALKCIGYLHEKGISTKSITLCGHSLGAAVSIVNAGMLKNVVGVAVGAPAVSLDQALAASMQLTSLLILGTVGTRAL